jgi:hypothetical protein
MALADDAGCRCVRVTCETVDCESAAVQRGSILDVTNVASMRQSSILCFRNFSHEVSKVSGELGLLRSGLCHQRMGAENPAHRGFAAAKPISEGPAREAFNKVEPDIEIKWVRDSTGVITAKLLAEKSQSAGY